MTRDSSIDTMVAALRDSVSQPADGGVATEQQILAKLQATPSPATPASLFSTAGASLCAVGAAWLALQWASTSQKHLSDHPQQDAKTNAQPPSFATPAPHPFSREHVGATQLSMKPNAAQSDPISQNAFISKAAPEQNTTTHSMSARKAATQRSRRRALQPKPGHHVTAQTDTANSLVSETHHQNSSAQPKPDTAPSLPETSAQVALSVEQASMQFRAAHRLQFNASPQQALAAWDRFLAQAPKGIFRVEAEFNRAIVLTRLGRSKEASAALEPFAQGIYGEQRMAQAKRLLNTVAH